MRIEDGNRLQSAATRLLWLCALVVLPGIASCGSVVSGEGGQATAAGQSAPLPPRTIRLTANADVDERELVSLGIPFAPGELADASQVSIVDANGAEVPAFVKPTLYWHWLDGSIRSVKVQFFADPGRTYAFRFDSDRTKSIPEEPYDRGTRPGKMDAPVPRVIATLDPQWLVHSRVAGPQLVHDGKRPYDRYIDRQWRWASDVPYEGQHAFLFDRASVVGLQYVRNGRPEHFAEFYNAATFYLSKIKTTGRGGGWPDCTGGWEFDGANPCDTKYAYMTPQLLLVALAGDDTRIDADTVRHMVANQVKGGWSGPLGPYIGADQSWTERHTGLALEHLVSAWELTGSAAVRQHIDDLLGWLYAHQQTPPGGDPVTGAWTHSWQAHEGSDYDPASDVRGGSPWMSANIVGGLWRAWLVTEDERIPVMLRDFGRYLDRHGFAPEDLAGRWRSSCNAGGVVGWYFSSGIAPLEQVVAIQENEGYGSDTHNPELLMAIAAARYFDTDPQWRERLERRAEQAARYLNPDCAAVSHTARAFNWQNRNPEFTWLLAQ
ncbi:hypothetical protein ACOPJQ_10140 [Luteimonas dalianensis]|uniref:hypothetical protein n=1 Tax=Luteimonas dalianensis TaxID=1148196 RepID=UPI003BF357AD